MATAASVAPRSCVLQSSAAPRLRSAASTSCASASSSLQCGFRRLSVARDALRPRALHYAGLQWEPLRATSSRNKGFVRSCLPAEREGPFHLWSLLEDIEEHVLVTSSDGEIRWKETLSAALLATATFLQVGGSANAGEFGPRYNELPEFRTTSEGWVVVGLTSLVAAFIYLFVVPLGLYYYLDKRWYKRSTLETFFQFLMVFLFFPGLLLLAPFINLRRLPKDGTEAP